MSRLSASDREVLVLRYFEDKPLDEGGKVFGVTEPAAQKRGVGPSTGCIEI